MRNFLVLTLSLLPTLAFAGPSPSISCVFTEPFATIQVWPGFMRAQHEGPPAIVSNIAVAGTSSEPIITALVGGTPTTLSITNGEGSDGMSDAIYPQEGTLTGWMMGTTSISGGCVGFPTGSKPFSIIGLSQNDQLNLRAQPSARARILHELSSQAVVWSNSQPNKAGWVRVATRIVPDNGPNNDNGDVKVAIGWVRASYLRQLLP